MPERLEPGARVGLDLLSLERMQRALVRPAFAAQFLAPEELRALEAVQARDPDQAVLLAALAFAYKEAVLKALGTGAWQEGTDFRDVHLHFEQGPTLAPRLVLEAGAARRAEALAACDFELEHGVCGGRVWALCRCRLAESDPSQAAQRQR